MLTLFSKVSFEKSIYMSFGFHGTVFRKALFSFQQIFKTDFNELVAVLLTFLRPTENSPTVRINPGRKAKHIS